MKFPFSKIGILILALSEAYPQQQTSLAQLETAVSEATKVVDSAREGLGNFERDNQAKLQELNAAVRKFEAEKNSLLKALRDELESYPVKRAKSALDESEKLLLALTAKHEPIILKELKRQADTHGSPLSQYLDVTRNRKATDLVSRAVFLKHGGNFGPYGNAYYHEEGNVHFVNIRNMYVRSDFDLQALNKILRSYVQEAAQVGKQIDEINTKRDLDVTTFVESQKVKIRNATAMSLAEQNESSLLREYAELKGKFDKASQQLAAVKQVRDRQAAAEAKLRREAEARELTLKRQAEMKDLERKRALAVQEEQRRKEERIYGIRSRLTSRPSALVGFPVGHKMSLPTRSFKQQLAGKVFVTAKSAENFKLGGVRVVVYSAADFAFLTVALRRNLEHWKQYLSDDEVFHNLTGEWFNGAPSGGLSKDDLYRIYSGFPDSGYSSETDADGGFQISNPYEDYVIFAVASRHVGGGVEYYLWNVRSSSVKDPERVLLNNNNMESMLD